ncbi:hypothetical protein ACFE04_014261 [Oxalis oulophora]
MDVNKNPLLLFIAHVLLFAVTSLGANTISAHTCLSGDQTIISKGKIFELGFFKPGKSSNYYIGMWYKQVSKRTYVWVANREQPVFERFSCVLKISDGNLVLFNESNASIWSTNISRRDSNLVAAVLQDDGNLVLSDGSKSSNRLWQSFDHPADTWLPGSTIGLDKRTNKSRKIISWKNKEDPAPGLFSFELDPNENQSRTYWSQVMYHQIIGLVNNETESYFYYGKASKSLLLRFTIDSSGQFKELTWWPSKETKTWFVDWSQPNQQCDVYALCGSFGVCSENSLPCCSCMTGFEPKSQKDWDLGDFSSGCKRKTILQCGTGNNSGDKFLPQENITMPDSYGNVGVGSQDECESVCLRRCSCTVCSYNYNDCLTWSGDDLLDMEQLAVAEGNTINIRLAAPKCNTTKKDNMAKNVGILALDIYFPPTCVQQEALEVHDGASKGKYTIGLGQDCMAFCTQVEDVISMSLTVVSSILDKYKVDPKQIGRLEVGSETVIDKSKSIKTFLMQIFEKCGNTDIEGVDSTNACYGGTAALLNCVNWVESSSWDGRYGLVVCTDSAVYAEGPARPTGGAAAIALLIGPDAPIVFESKVRASHMSHVYDFYKPNLASEYPVVDGKLSQTCYLMALDSCYKQMCQKYEKLESKPFSISDADYFVFHSPYNKLVQKSFARLIYGDFLRNASSIDEAAREKLGPFETLSSDESYQSRDLEKVSQQVAKPLYDTKVQPTTLLPKQLGNMYTASLYAAFASLLHNKNDQLAGKRVVMFSYGSGLTATMFSLKLQEGQSPFSLSNIATVMNIDEKLKARHEVGPEKFIETLKLMEERYGAKDFVTDKDCSLLAPGTYYLTEVDSLYRRFYDQKALENGSLANGGH